MWLTDMNSFPLSLFGVLCFLAAGWSGLVVGFLGARSSSITPRFVSIRSHMSGSKRYLTGDDFRNNWLLAVFTMGEGWHNNHHAYQSSVRQGFRWWEIDPTYYLLRALSPLGLVWDLKTPPEQVLRNEQRLGSQVINRAAEQLAAHFDSERIAVAITSALHESELSTLQETLIRAHHRTSEVLKSLHLPHVPSRDEFLREARAMFARTRSLDEIVDRAYEFLLVSVGRCLAVPTEHNPNS